MLKTPLPLVLLLLVVINLATSYWHTTLARQRQENLLLASPTAGAMDSRSARWDKSIGENLDQYLPSIPDATRNRLAIVSGVSQMYAVNNPKPSDKIIVEHLDDLFVPFGLRAFGLAAPNMHNEEALLLLLTALSSPRTHPNYFIFGVCFDKFRNVDVRPGMQRLLRTHPELAANWRDAAIKYRDRYPKASEKMLLTMTEAITDQKEQEVTFEERLRTQVANYLPLVAARQDINANVMLELFEFRNWLLNITPQSKRQILQSRYELNQEFLKMIADIAKENRVVPVYYLIPLNPLAENPYIPAQYDMFKLWLQSYCQKNKIPFANLEGVVPSQFWGEYLGQPDFMHFRGEGHAITANAILKEFGPLLRKGNEGQ
jgi:hypothetical protein